MAGLLTRTLGSGAQALTVSAQGFGCMGMTANYVPPPPPPARPSRPLLRFIGPPSRVREPPSRVQALAWRPCIV
jgi:hypothetical protein